jgi:arylsulfatase A-like enzyme
MLAVALRTLSADEPARKPNVLIIVADDLGYADVGFNGSKEIPTPHLDALAKAGTRFTNGYVSCPVCSPTRAGLVTGRYQQRFGHEFNPGAGGVRDDFGLPLTETTIAGALKSAGYATGLVGKWHLGSAAPYVPTARGYDEFFGFLGGAHPYLFDRPDTTGQPILRGTEATDEKEYLTDAIGREAVSFIERHRDEPFLLQVTFNAVHNPLQATDKYLERFGNIADPKHRAYAAMLSAMDDNVGRVLDRIHKLKLDENTLVFFVGDNGGPEVTTSSNGQLHGYKGSVWEGGIRVPFLMRWTGRVPAGVDYDQPVIALDIATTAAAAAGAKLGDKPLDGVNLLPFVTGESKKAPHQQLFWRFGPQWAIRQGNYKLLKFGEDAPQLYDLSTDVGEKKDLAKDKPEIVSQLTKTYSDWNSQLEEPRWKPAGRGGKQLEKRKRRQAAR